MAGHVDPERSFEVTGARMALISCLALGIGCSTPATEKAAAPIAPVATATKAAVRWVALGDSYTRGEAAERSEAWPAVAADRLRAEGRSVELVANLGRTGWTASDVLAQQVPFLDSHPADFVTVQVGINDLVQGVGESDFRAAFGKLLDAVLTRVRKARRVVAVTIPDFSVARAAPSFGDPAQIHADIVHRNAIIAEESERRFVLVADVFERSRDAVRDSSLLANDGIHPSAAGYADWVPAVLPVLEKALDRN